MMTGLPLKTRIPLDRLLTLHCVGRILRPRMSKGLHIPILMYHSISDDAETTHPYYWINTSQARFLEQMQFLHDHDYHVFSLSQAVEMIRVYDSSYVGRYDSCGSKHVVLTFDDGYGDFYSHAFPVLDQFGFTATVFLPVGYIGNGDLGLRGKRHLTWGEVRTLAGRGITFGSHTVNHPQLLHLEKRDIMRELRESRWAIEQNLDQSATAEGIDSFCYPYRFPDQEMDFMIWFKGALKEAGYTNCVTTRIGSSNSAEDILCLKRLPISTADDSALLHAKLDGHYDWVSLFQSITKRIDRRTGKGLHAWWGRNERAN
jgi:peptidoglycan/xylan/chitin deacetylase (PgdA/CDA1 family)